MKRKSEALRKERHYNNVNPQCMPLRGISPRLTPLGSEARGEVRPREHLLLTASVMPLTLSRPI